MGVRFTDLKYISNYGPEKLPIICLRLCVIGGFIYTWIAQRNLPPEVVGDDKFGSYWRYLSNQNFLMCIFSNILFLVADFFERVRGSADVVNVSLAFPISCILFIYYWGMRFVDRDLVMLNDEVTAPVWHDLVMHVGTLIAAVANILHLRLTDSSPWLTYGLSVAYWISYGIFTHIIYKLTGEWIYGFADHLGEAGWWGILAPITITLTFTFQKIGWILNGLVHKKESMSKKQSIEKLLQDEPL